MKFIAEHNTPAGLRCRMRTDVDSCGYQVYTSDKQHCVVAHFPLESRRHFVLVNVVTGAMPEAAELSYPVYVFKHTPQEEYYPPNPKVPY